jgi:hypothetical protein
MSQSGDLAIGHQTIHKVMQFCELMKSPANLNAFIHFLAFSKKVEESFRLDTFVKNNWGLHHVPPEGGLAPPLIHWLPVGFLAAFHRSFFSISKTSFIETNQLNWLKVWGDINIIWTNISMGIASFGHVLYSV